MGRPVRVTVASVASSAVIPLELNVDPFNVGIGCDVSAGASLTYTVQHTFDDVYSTSFDPATATWFSNSAIVAQTADKDGNYAYPVTAVRLTVTARVSGSVTMTVIQAGI
jgi:hypothetical protein